MQLQSLAKITEALNSITSVLNTTYKTKKEYEEALTIIGQSYTTETLKAALAQSTLNKQQIKTILSANGLQGETLKLTTEELANAASTSAVAASQAGATATTLGLGTAFKGLWIVIKKATAAMVKFLFTTPAGIATLTTFVIIGLSKIYDVLATQVEKQREKLNDLKQEYSEVTSKLKSLESELKTTAQRMKELESLDSPSFADKEEYDNLVKTNRELQRKIDLLKLEKDAKNQETRKAFVETMEKDTDGQWDKDDAYFYWGNPFNINPQNLGKGNPWPYIVATSFLPYPGSIQTQAVPEDKLISVYNGYQTELEELNEKYADDLENRTYKKKKEKLEKKIKELSTYLQKKGSQWESDSSDIEYIENPAPDSEDEAVNKWLDYIADFQDRVAIAMGAENAKVNAFNRLIDNWQFDDTVQELEDLGKEGKVTAEMLDNDNYKGFIDKLVFLGVIDSADNLDDIALAFNNLAVAAKNADGAPLPLSDIFSLKSTDGTLTNLGKLSESIDTIQNAYKTLNDAIDEYNENGVFSIDTLQSVIALGDDWLDYLVDEEGNLTLDKEALERLTCARLNDMRVQAINNVIDNVSKIKDDAKANEYLASTNYALADSYEAVAKAELDNARKSMAEAVKAGDLSQDNMDEALKKAAADIDKINNLFDNTNIAEDSIMGGFDKSGSGSATSEFSETVDFFERRITVLDDALSHLKSTMDNVSGSFGRNNLIDAELGITEEKFHNYSDALSMYTQKANEAFAKIPADIAAKVKDGAVALNDFIGDGSQDVVEAFKDYESWAGKVSDCQQNLAELKKEIRQLELEKFNNIISDFTNQFDLRENSKNLISKLIDLFKESGELIGESFYAAQLEQSKKQLKLLEDEKAQLVDRMTSSVSSGKIQKGTEEWLKMVNALSDVDGNILDCKKSIEEFDNSILALHTEVFERIQAAFGNLSCEISNLIGLMEDSDVGSPDGSWTKEGLTQLGLYAQQYELAKYQVSQYAGEIEKLNVDYLNGRYSATEYADKLADLSSAQWDAVNTAESAKDAIVDLNRARVDIAVDALQEQINAYKELTDAQIKALQAEKDLHDYEKSLAEKEKDIAKLRKQIAAMQNDKNAATVAKRKQLEEQLAEALADLEETQYQHSIEAQEEALNQQYEDYEELRNKEMEALEDSLKDEEKLISDSLNAVKRNTEIISNQIVQIARDHGISVSNEIVNAWKSGENAIASYGEVLTAGTSAFIGQIQSVEAQIYRLQDDADVTAATFANLFATKADNLVNELTESYYAEANLYNMTQALQNSLTATLEGGYDVSSIVNSLHKIEDAATNAIKALRDFYDVNKPTVNGGGSESFEYPSGHGSGSNFSLAAYADGSENIPKDQLAVTNEAGQEIIYHAKDNSLLTRLSAGDKVFDNASVDKLWEISHGKLPAALIELLPSLKQPIPFSVPPVVSSLQIPDRSNERPTFHYDSLVTINGDVNDTDHFIKQMAKVADQQITKSWKKFNDEFKY